MRHLCATRRRLHGELGTPAPGTRGGTVEATNTPYSMLLEQVLFACANQVVRWLVKQTLDGIGFLDWRGSRYKEKEEAVSYRRQTP